MNIDFFDFNQNLFITYLFKKAQNVRKFRK